MSDHNTQEVTMRDLIVRRPQQRALTFDRRDLWQTLPDLVQRQCGELMGHLLRAVLHAEASTRSDDDRENSTRSS
jgi:hypothetical protein